MNKGYYKIVTYNNSVLKATSPLSYYEILDGTTGDTIFKRKKPLLYEEVSKFIYDDTLVDIQFGYNDSYENGGDVIINIYDLNSKPVVKLNEIVIKNEEFSRIGFVEHESEFMIILSYKIPFQDGRNDLEINRDKMRCIKISIPLLKIIRDYYVDSENQ